MINSVGNICLVTSHQQLLIICYCSGCQLLFYGQGTDSFQTRYTHYCSILRASWVFNWSFTNRELALPTICTSAFRRGCAPAFWRVCTPAFRRVCTPVFRRVCTPAFWRVCIPAFWRGCTPAFRRSSTSQRCSYILFIYSIVPTLILTKEQLVNIYHT